MGKENQSGNKGLFILLVIFIIFTIVLGGFVIYDRVLKTENNEKEVNENNNVSSLSDTTLKYNYEISKKTINQAIREGHIEILIDTDGNAYLYTIGNLDYENNGEIRKNLQNIEKQFKTYSPKGYTSLDGSTTLNAYKLKMTGVLTAYCVHVGNGGSSFFVFIKENGNVSYLSSDDIIYNGQIEVTDINNLSNVVSIVENTYTMTPYAITLDGTEISLSNYIK